MTRFALNEMKQWPEVNIRKLSSRVCV